MPQDLFLEDRTPWHLGISNVANIVQFLSLTFQIISASMEVGHSHLAKRAMTSEGRTASHPEPASKPRIY